jgi:hypothetical protein
MIKQGRTSPKDHQDVVDRATHREPFLRGPRKIVHSTSRFGGVSHVDRNSNNTLESQALEGTSPRVKPYPCEETGTRLLLRWARIPQQPSGRQVMA